MFTHINGDEYFGMWANDSANQWGFFTRKEDSINGHEVVTIEGFFKNDQQNGFCIMKVGKSGSIFKGKFALGMKEGWGVLTSPDGSCLEGNWVDGKMNGVGQYVWNDGRSYRGFWRD